MSESKTPRIDGAVRESDKLVPHNCDVEDVQEHANRIAVYGRILETELTEAQAENAKLTEKLTNIVEWLEANKPDLTDRKLRKELAEANERLAAYDSMFKGLVYFKPTVEQVNALPEGVRRYVCDLETRCDPAGDVAALTLTRDQNVMLQAENAKLREVIVWAKNFLYAPSANDERNALKVLKSTLEQVKV